MIGRFGVHIGVSTTAALALLLAVSGSLCLAQLQERPGNSTDDPVDVPHDLSGCSIKNPRVRVVHTTDPALAGGSMYLKQEDPWLGYQWGRSLTQREFRERDGWTTLGLTTILAVGLAAGPVAAQTGGPADPPKPDDPLQELERLRSDTIRSFQAAKKDIDALREEVGRLRKELDDHSNLKPPANRISGYGPTGDESVLPAAQRDIEPLKEQIAQLGKSLDNLRNTRPAERRFSNYGPAGDAAATGSIVLLNTYPAEMTVVVNGERYTLVPGEKRVLAGWPAGAFTYEVVGVQLPVERMLAANAVFPIQIHP